MLNRYSILLITTYLMASASTVSFAQPTQSSSNTSNQTNVATMSGTEALQRSYALNPTSSSLNNLSQQIRIKTSMKNKMLRRGGRMPQFITNSLSQYNTQAETNYAAIGASLTPTAAKSVMQTIASVDKSLFSLLPASGNMMTENNYKDWDKLAALSQTQSPSLDKALTTVNNAIMSINKKMAASPPNPKQAKLYNHQKLLLTNFSKNISSIKTNLATIQNAYNTQEDIKPTPSTNQPATSTTSNVAPPPTRSRAGNSHHDASSRSSSYDRPTNQSQPNLQPSVNPLLQSFLDRQKAAAQAMKQNLIQKEASQQIQSNRYNQYLRNRANTGPVAETQTTQRYTPKADRPSITLSPHNDTSSFRPGINASQSFLGLASSRWSLTGYSGLDRSQVPSKQRGIDLSAVSTSTPSSGQPVHKIPLVKKATPPPETPAPQPAAGPISESGL